MKESRLRSLIKEEVKRVLTESLKHAMMEIRGYLGRTGDPINPSKVPAAVDPEYAYEWYGFLVSIKKPSGGTFEVSLWKRGESPAILSAEVDGFDVTFIGQRGEIATDNFHSAEDLLTQMKTLAR